MDIHALIGDRLHVYRREGSPFWQCATYLAGKNHRVSTKERDLERAKKIASDWYLNLQVKDRAGELTDGPTFRRRPRSSRPNTASSPKASAAPNMSKAMSMRLRVHLLPFLRRQGGQHNHAPDGAGLPGPPDDLADPHPQGRYRRGPAPGPQHPPSRNHHRFAMCCKTAQRHGWLKYLPDLSAPYKASGKISHRAWFTPDEYKQLYTATRERAANPPKPRWTWECEQLHDFVLFMVNTGLRPDEACAAAIPRRGNREGSGDQQTILEISCVASAASAIARACRAPSSRSGGCASASACRHGRARALGRTKKTVRRPGAAQADGSAVSRTCASITSMQCWSKKT